jgi:hypothetical protein
MVQDFVLNQFVQDFVHWRLVHQQNVILGQSLAIFSDYIYIYSWNVDVKEVTLF